MASCSKIPYETKAQARKDAKRSIIDMKRNKKQVKQVDKLYPYVCSRCGHWHLTSMNQKLFKRLRRVDIKNKTR